MLRDIFTAFFDAHIVFIILVLLGFMLSWWLSYKWGIRSAEDFSGPEGRLTGVRRNIYPYGGLAVMIAMFVTMYGSIPGLSYATEQEASLADILWMTLVMYLLAVGVPSLIATLVCRRQRRNHPLTNLSDS